MTWAKVRERIREYAKLTDGWDGCGGKGPTPATIRATLQWSTSMETLGFPPPHPAVQSDGTICFEWERDGHCVYVTTPDEFSALYEDEK